MYSIVARIRRRKPWSLNTRRRSTRRMWMRMKTRASIRRRTRMRRRIRRMRRMKRIRRMRRMRKMRRTRRMTTTMAIDN